MGHKKQLAKRKKKKFKDKEKSFRPREVTGTFSGTRHGYGFVAVENQKDDIFVPARKVLGALTGDTVRLSIGKTPRPERGGRAPRGPSGEVIQIVERANEEVVGVLRKNEAGQWIAEARVEAFPDVRLTNAGRPDLKEGDLVRIRIKCFPTERHPMPEGEVIERLGVSGEPVAEEKAIILKFHLSETFPAAVAAEAERFPKTVEEKDVQGRRDLREKLFFTIDGERARDFDDAVCLELVPKGFRLLVAIADVAQYVTEGSALNEEAFARATSVYFPTRAIHMLPTPLSAGLCSLVPNQDRLALVAEMVFDRQGTPQEAQFYEAVFYSYARLTYDEVESVLKSGQFAADEPKVSPLADPAIKEKVVRSLSLMNFLKNALFQKRRARGSLDFDLPEAEFVFTEGAGPHAIENILRGERQESHKLIEEFMIAANEAVAEFITAQKIPMPYRVHDQPDPVKIQAFLKVIEKHPEFQAAVAREGGGKGGNKDYWAQPGFLSRVLEQLKDLPDARFLNQLLLRSLKLAVYSPVNRGHYGLASRCYAHFTSPIRRYPDLLLHRIVKAFLRTRAAKVSFEKVKEECEHCSNQEQIAVSAEREVIQFYKVRFMRERIGQSFKGVIVKTTTFGFFVELEEIFVDGFVPLETLPPDSDLFREEKQAIFGKKHVYAQGDELTVRVAAVDIDRRRITFTVE